MIVLIAALLAALALAACGSSSSPAVYVACVQTKAGSFVLARVPHQRPASCELLGEPEFENLLTRLREAHWSSWGGATATGEGGIAPNHCPAGGCKHGYSHCVGAECKPTPSGPIVLSQIVSGCQGREYYTRMQVQGRTYTLSHLC